MSEIKLTGVVKECLPAVSGTSKTGREWKKQGFVLEYEGGQFPRSVRFDVIGQEKIERFAIQYGETITVSLDISAREFNGNYYNDITCWRVEREQQYNAVAAQIQAPQQAQSPAVVYPEAHPQTTQQTAPKQAEGDLPF